MKKDFQWLIWAFIIAVSVIAASCDRPTIIEQANQKRADRDSIMRSQYPYEWDTVIYSLSEDEDGEMDTVRTVVIFNEEYIDVNGNIFDGGEWVNRHTYKMEKVTIKVTPLTLWMMSDDQRTNIRLRKQ